MTLGRDLVRLLQYVARIPEIEKIWKDILHNPTALSPTFTGRFLDFSVVSPLKLIRVGTVIAQESPSYMATLDIRLSLHTEVGLPQ